MIHIIAKNLVKESQIETFKVLTKELILKSKEEEGCIAYDLYEDMNNPTILTFIEMWSDEEAIEKHNQSDHFNKIVPKLGKLIKDKEVSLYKKVPINLKTN
ncbi:MAG TPA: putative quinol monooxygenase [Clostridia bacterium]|nr:putative quinol monooxygenase [Clostridia bacterium]